MKENKNLAVVKLTAPQIVHTTMLVGGIFCEIVQPKLEPNPHIELDAYQQSCTVRAQVSVSSNVAAYVSSFSTDAVVATQGTLAHSIDAFVVRFKK
jgi:hypothetical protein